MPSEATETTAERLMREYERAVRASDATDKSEEAARQALYAAKDAAHEARMIRSRAHDALIEHLQANARKENN